MSVKGRGGHDEAMAADLRQPGPSRSNGVGWYVFEHLAELEATDTNSVEDMTPEQRLVFAFNFLRQEVNSGGFDAYFRYSGGDTTACAQQAARAIVGTRWAALIADACRVVGSPYPQTAEVREKVLDQLADAQRDLLNGLDDRLYALEQDQPPESGQSCGGGGSIGTTAPSGPRSASGVLCASKGVSGVMESRGGGMRWLVAGFGVVALLVAGCASGSFGMVAGTFQGVAGPVSPSGQPAVGPWPLSGVVRFTDASGHTVEVTVGASGKFSVRLAPGTYTSWG